MEEAAAPRAPVPKARAAGRRLMFFTNGSRGDVQPFAALGSALQAAGFLVRTITNVNHVGFFESFGLDAVGMMGDAELAIEENAAIREALATGDIKTWMKGLEELNMEEFPSYLLDLIEAVDSWKPDVVISTILTATEVHAIAGVRKIPKLHASLQCTMPSKQQMTALCEPSWAHQTAGTLLAYLFWAGENRVKSSTILERLPDAKPFVSLSFRQFMLQVSHPYTPTMIAISPTLQTPPSDWTADARERIRFTGFWVVPEEEQQARLQKEDPAFGGGDSAAIRDFVATGPVVYLGWGSMLAVSEVHMACLAVRSLMKAKLRGIILGGWAKLSPSMLEGQTDSSEMVAYAKNNVLFVKTAPHEWLFPKCQAIVHHGGSGTTAAALRSGVPTVITPCAVDQFDFANRAAASGAGIALKQFSKVTVSDLAAALKRCVTDEMLIQSAKALAQTLRAESGLRTAVDMMDSFIVDEVDTGLWLKNFERRTAEMRQLQARKSPGCLYWLARLCCSPWPNDYSVKLQQQSVEKHTATDSGSSAPSK